MSRYSVSKVLYSLNDPDSRKEFHADPPTYLSGRQDLDDEEHRALIERDVIALHRMGVSIYLIRTLELIHGTGIVETGLKFGGPGPLIDSKNG